MPGVFQRKQAKESLISMNNGLVKEYFRAIKEIRPRAFVMENVSMLRSDTHRFYESYKDNDEIEALVSQGYSIPKRTDSVLIADCTFAGIDYTTIEDADLDTVALPEALAQLLSVLNKNKANPRRLPNFLAKTEVTFSSLLICIFPRLSPPQKHNNTLLKDYI